MVAKERDNRVLGKIELVKCAEDKTHVVVGPAHSGTIELPVLLLLAFRERIVWRRHEMGALKQ